MKKYILLLALVITGTFNVFAQLPDGSIAPDFTATDINGVEYNLYDLLDEGKTVILDIAATWCEPCWTYHEDGALKRIWEEYGPEGSNEMFVFLIEGDDDTGIEDLMGNTNNTTGDWISGTPYPIVNDESIATAYEIIAYPSVFSICPDRTTTFIGQVSTAEHYDASLACPPVVVGANNVAVGAYTGTTEVTCGNAVTIVTPELSIYNYGTNVLSVFTAELVVDGSSVETVEWTGNIASQGMSKVTFSDIEVRGAADLSFVLSEPNGSSDDIPGNNRLSKSIGSDKKSDVDVTLEVTTDFWAEETTWQLKDDMGNTLYSNIDEGTLTCDETYVQNYTLEIGRCYTFAIQDEYGDGILNGSINPDFHDCTTVNGNNNQAMGAVRLSSSRGVIYNNIEFGEGAEVDFLVIDPTSIKTIGLQKLNIVPNPAQDYINVNFDLTASTDLAISLYNVFGQKIKSTALQSYLTGQHQLSFDTANLPDGVYFVNISDGANIQTEKIILAR